jgi:hypothetical protein
VEGLVAAEDLEAVGGLVVAVPEADDYPLGSRKITINQTFYTR